MKKRIYALFIIFLAFVFFSCSTNKNIQDNIYIEYYNIAEEYMDLKKYDKAAEYYTKAMSNKELYVAALFKSGRAYALNKDWGPAEQIYIKLLKKDPQNKDIRVSLAYITAMMGENEKSCKMYEDLISEYPDDSDLFKNYIIAVYSTEDYEKTKNLIAKYKDLFPDKESDLETIEKEITDTDKKDDTKE